MRKDGGYLSVTWGRLAVVFIGMCTLWSSAWVSELCQLFDAGLRVSTLVFELCQLFETGWWLSVSYMRQDDGYLSVVWGMMTVICQLHVAGWRLSVSYMSNVGPYLSVTWGSLALIRQLHEAAWPLSYLLHEACVRLSLSYTSQDYGYLSVTWGRLVVICQLHEAGFWYCFDNYFTYLVSVLLTAETFEPLWSGRFGALQSYSADYFFRYACTKSGSLRFSQFSGCWLILSVYILMSFEFSFGRLFGVR